MLLPRIPAEVTRKVIRTISSRNENYVNKNYAEMILKKLISTTHVQLIQLNKIFRYCRNQVRVDEMFEYVKRNS